MPATLAVLLNDPGSYVGDNRFEQFWSPAWRMARETMLWDGTRGMGRVGEEFWPGTAPFALLRGLGLSPAATQHVWHALILVLAGLGVAAVIRQFERRIGPAHVIAALAYMFNPYAATFLVPSNLYWNYMLAPWLLVCFIGGVRSSRPWRWGAAFALLVFTAGDTDLPGLVYAALWIVPTAVYLVHVEHEVTWRRLLGFVARAAVLTLAVSAAMLVKVVYGAGALAQRLLYTESPRQVNQVSSWSESWRGLGYWLSYFRDPSRASSDLPGGLYYYESGIGVFVTFLLPAAALLVVWRSRWRVRALWGSIAVLSVTLMVGSYPPSNPSPLGSVLLELFTTVPSLTSFRNTYKAGSGLLIAVAVLLGVGVAIVGPQLGAPRTLARAVPGAAAVALIVATSLPFWNGGLYPADKQMTDVPTYWRDAMRWIEDQPGDGRVLVLPGSTQTAYRWGWAGDDILDSYLHRHPNVVPTSFPVSGTLTANLVDALEARAKEGTLTADMVAPIARRLGVSYVVLRNDLDWQRLREPRPARFDAVRHGDALEPVKRFGRQGQNTAARDDSSKLADRERKLAPVEVLRVPGSATQQLALPPEPPLLVSGDGQALVALAASGDLTGRRPVEYTGTLTPDQITRRLRDGSALVVSDTNRRRLSLIRGPSATSSETLAAGQELDQPPQDLFGRPGTQTVVSFGDATAITASGSGARFSGFSPQFRAANAFDELDSTSWRSGGYENPVGQWIQVDLKRDETIDAMELRPYRPSSGGRYPTQVRLSFSSGPDVTVDLTDDPVTKVSFAPHKADWVRATITGVNTTEGNAPAGFTEITIPGLDLKEVVTTPTDVFRSGDPTLDRALTKAQVTYLFQRAIGAGKDSDEEVALRRRFLTAGTRDYDVTGQLSLDANPTDKLLDELAGGPVGAYGSSRVGPVADSWGGLAVDGDPTTSWAGAPRPGENLTVRFPAQQVDTVKVVVPTGPLTYPLRQVLVTAGQSGDVVPIDLAPDPSCTQQPCPLVGTADLRPARLDSVTLSIDEGDNGGRPVRIAEVQISGPDGVVPPAPADRSGAAGGACADTVLAIDGTPYPIRLTSSIDDFLRGQTGSLQGCEPLELGPGKHLLTTFPSVRTDVVRIATGEEARPRVPTPASRVTSRTPTSIHVTVDGPAGTLVTTGMSYDARWRATADGKDLGPPVEVNGLSAWALPSGGRQHVVLDFAPQRVYGAALAVTAAALLGCAALVIHAAGARYRRPDPARRPDREAS